MRRPCLRDENCFVFLCGSAALRQSSGSVAASSLLGYGHQSMPMRSWSRRLALIALLVLAAAPSVWAEDGYELWLRYPLISDASLLKHYQASAASLLVAGDSATVRAAQKELERGLRGLLGRDIPPLQRRQQRRRDRRRHTSDIAAHRGSDTRDRSELCRGPETGGQRGLRHSVRALQQPAGHRYRRAIPMSACCTARFIFSACCRRISASMRSQLCSLRAFAFAC